MGKCKDDCEIEDCKICLKKFHQDAEKKAKEIQEKISRNLSNKRKNFFLTNLESNSSEYLDIVDQVYGSNLSMHNWQKAVTKIEKITNYRYKIVLGTDICTYITK